MTNATPSPDADLIACPTCGGPMWDNRLTKRNPNAPDFKCRDKACDGVIWPEKGARSAPKGPKRPPPAKAAGLNLGPYIPEMDTPPVVREAVTATRAYAQEPGKITTIHPDDIKLMGACLEAGIRAVAYAHERSLVLAPEDMEMYFSGEQVCSVAATLFIETRKRG